MKQFDARQQAGGMVGLCVIEHGLRRVAGQDHPIAMLGQNRPETPGSASQIQDQSRLARNLERPAHQAPLAPQHEPAGKPLGLYLQANLRMLAVKLLGELMLYRGGRWLR